jgi:predicted phage terminase large subunit-like protein
MAELLKIQPIIDQYGEAITRQYLLNRFRNPASIVEFKNLFPNHITIKNAPFHNEILSAIPKGGKQAYAAPRGFAKSTTVNVIGLFWLSLNSHYRFILLISDTYTQAKMHLAALKAELEANEVLQWLYGDIQGKTWGEDTIIVNGIDGPVMIMALGAGMKIRGLKFMQFRPQLAVIDDLENLEVVYSADRRLKLERWFNYDLIPGLSKEKNVIYIGTILHYHALLKKVVDRQEKYQGWLTKLYKAIENGVSSWPEAYSLDYLMQIRDNPKHPDYVGSLVFAQEFQNEPQDDKDRIVKIDWIKDYSFAAKIRSFEGISDVQRRDAFIKSLERVAGVDPAIGEKEQNDFFSMYGMGFDKADGSEYMLDLIHGKFTIDEQVERIVNFCLDWQIEILGIESNAYQKGLAQLVKPALQKAGAATRIKEIITDKDKIRRARIHSVAFEGGFVKLRIDHPLYARIRQELEEFPAGEHDDAFDSLMLARECRAQQKARAFTNKPKGF